MNENMIAPCGLNCALCKRALQKESPCPGCLGDDSQKPEFCANRCLIHHCELRKSLPDRYCDSCEKYPCKDVIEKEIRYSNAYPLIETPIGNLSYLRENGMDAFLQREDERWRCPACHGTVCVQTGVCAECGASYTQRKL